MQDKSPKWSEVIVVRRYNYEGCHKDSIGLHRQRFRINGPSKTFVVIVMWHQRSVATPTIGWKHTRMKTHTHARTKSINQSVGRSINQSINQSIDAWVTRTIVSPSRNSPRNKAAHTRDDWASSLFSSFIQPGSASKSPMVEDHVQIVVVAGRCSGILDGCSFGTVR